MNTFLRKYRNLWVFIAIWIVAGAYAGGWIAVATAIATYFLIVQSGRKSQILLGLLAILIFSDSRSDIFQFAVDAKIGFALLGFYYVLSNWKNLPAGYNQVFRFFIPFFVYVFLLIPFASDAFDALQKTFSYAIIFLIVPVLLAGAVQDDERFLIDLIGFVLVILIIGLALRFINPAFVTLADRYRGLLGNPNGLGIFLTLVFPIFYTVLESKAFAIRNSTKWTFYAIFIISLLLCQSRTAILACGLFLLFNAVPVLRGGIGLLLFLVLVFSYEYLLSQLPVIVLALNLGEYFRIDTLLEGSGRVIAWEFAWNKIQDVFFFGGGFDYTNNLYYQYYDYLSRLGHQGNAHNSFLTLWLDTGVVGLVFFVIGLVRTAVYAMSRTPYTLPVLYGVLFSTNFESWLAASLNPFTSLFLIILTILCNPDLLSTAGEPQSPDSIESADPILRAG